MADKETLNYSCWYCGYKFNQEVSKTGSKKHGGSSQVVCPACGNFLKTWDN